MKGVVVVEDDEDYARSLTALLEEAPEFEFLGHWFSAEACLEGLSELAREPDIFVVDMGLPGADGAQLIAQLKERQPMASCVAHTVFEDKTHVFAALRAGADGYLLKGTAPGKLLDGLRSLDCGGAPLTPKARFQSANFKRTGCAGCPRSGIQLSTVCGESDCFGAHDSYPREENLRENGCQRAH